MKERQRLLLAALLRALASVAGGLLTVAIAHRASQASSRWALAHDLVELRGSWLLPRFAAWAVVSLVIGSLLGLVFGRRAVVPAVVAAITVPVVYLCNFAYLYGAGGLTLVEHFWPEFFTVVALLPSAALAVSKRHAA
jgi:hypothetical protein